MNETPRVNQTRRGTGVILLEFLGSMNLAITLLVVIAIASIIGTVLKQNQPYTDYVFKFGPFWFEVFKSLSLYNIYGSWWFLFLLGFLLVSTSVCVYRNFPGKWKEMLHFRLNVQEKSLRAFHQNDEWVSAESPQTLRDRFVAHLQRRGFKARSKDHGDHIVISGMKGSITHIGYVLSHVAIVVICLGGLFDGNIPMKIDLLTGALQIEKQDMPVTQVPKHSTLPADNDAFRGDVSIPEGSGANFVFLNVRNGYLVQNLPFSIEVKDFRIRHYESGKPKSFESDIVIHDPDRDAPLPATISVNHPLIYKQFAIYQASFSDGGSLLDLKAWPLYGHDFKPLPVHSHVSGKVQLDTPQGPRTLEFTNFKRYNIFPLPDNDPSGKKFINYGPSVIFKLRDAQGQAIEYVNYMQPVFLDGRAFYLSGMKTETGQPYRFLHIPVDPQGGIGRFMKFRQAVLDTDLVRKEAQRQTEEQFAKAANLNTDMRKQVTDSIVRLVGEFAQGGIDAVVSQVDKRVKDKAKQNEVLDSYIKVLQGMLGSLYVDVLKQEGVDLSKGVSQRDATYFDDSMNALSLMGVYGSPFYLQPVNFKEIQASGLEVTRSPGKDIVYLGCVMLIIGIFLMFYVHHRRFWVRVSKENDGARVLFAGSGNRQRLEFREEFQAMNRELQTLSGRQDHSET